MKKLFPLIQLILVFLFFCVSTFGQGIKGKVIDADIKEGIVGATVSIENSSYSTSTDLQGNYSLKIPKGDYKLIINFSGYEKKVISIVVPSTIITMPDISMVEATVATEDEVLVLVGSRAAEGRTKNESATPIDVITAEQLTAFGQMDLNQVLQFLVPSFNSNRHSGSDIADHIDPTSMRGFGPDQTLILLNGKRYHQTALIGTFGTRGRGNTGTDLNTIPIAAIDHIEILRDGAAAQYGSDAIAGVINIVLKSATKKEVSAYLQSGFYTKGDGLMFNGGVNYGLKIGEKGFLNITGEVLSKAKTFRIADSQYLDSNPRSLFGDASYTNNSIYMNSEFALGQKIKLYSTGGINFRSTDAQGFTVDFNSDRNILSIFPNGYEPRIGSDIFDANITVGVKSKLGAWDLDLYNIFGSNNIALKTLNTINPSQILSTSIKNQTNFDAGSYSISQNTTGLSVTRGFPDLLSGINLSLGSEYRIDNYRIVAGEEASWKRYGTDESIAGGAQNFPGINPNNAIKASRTNFGLYGDLEVNITNSWLIATALRYENYSDFGGTLNGKIASRIKVNDILTFRGSLSSGFRAPSLAQVYFSSTINDVVIDEVTQKPIYEERLLARNDSPITKALGIPTLKQETSLSGSFGFVLQPSKAFSVSVDAYQVSVKDRILLTGEFSASDKGLETTFNSLGVIGAQFFANAINTKSFGVDLIGNYVAKIGEGTLTTSLALNYNNLKIDAVNTTPALAGKEESFLGAREASLITQTAPKYKFHAILDYRLNKWSVATRLSGFSSIAIVNYNSIELPANSKNYVMNNYDGKISTDLTAGYQLTENVKISFNGSNIFNVYPNKQNPNNTETGGMYEAIQMGFGGSFYSLRLKLMF